MKLFFSQDHFIKLKLTLIKPTPGEKSFPFSMETYTDTPMNTRVCMFARTFCRSGPNLHPEIIRSLSRHPLYKRKSNKSKFLNASFPQ